MFNGAVWYDEAYSMAMIEHSFGEICRITAQDVHPPLYYFMLKIFTAPFGYSLIAAKIFSVIPLLLTLLLGFFKLSKAINKKTGLLFALMLAMLPVMTTFSVEVRMYGWASFFVTGCGLFAYSAQSGGQIRDFLIFALFGTLAAYTHYFALVSAGIIYAMLFVRCIKIKKIKPWLVSAALTVTAYIPWLASFVSQLADKVENAYWIAPITPSAVLNYFTVWFGCDGITPFYLTGIAVLAVCAAAALIINGDRRLNKIAACAALVFVLTNIIGIAASIAVRPVFIERYAVPSLPLLIAAGAIGLGAVTKKAVTVIITLFFISGFAANYPSAVKTEYDAAELDIKQYLDEAQYEALICFVDSHLYGVLSYYSDSAPVYRPKLSKGSPFENIYALSDFNAGACKWAALFVPAGEPVPDELAAQFNADYVRTVYTYGIACDMYNLWK